MSYLAKFLKAKGKICFINRTPIVDSKVLLKRLSNTINMNEYQGLMLADSNLQSGETFTADGENYLALLVEPEIASGELEVICYKSNTTVDLYSETSTVDENHNIITGWNPKSENIIAFMVIVTASLRHEEVGLLDNTKYLLYIPKNVNAIERERIIYNDNKLDIVDIDDVEYKGVSRLQLATDVRS